jgi:NADH dehydrogenase (ubiquinone) 1 alpha subcomplex subunit 5
MRAATRLLARVKPQRLLEPGNPTGLTGLFTHPAPRSTLIYYYNSTLDKLKQIPESSVYRQSTEALTKHRLAIVESVKPEGYDAWEQRMDKHIAGRAETLEQQGLAIRRQAGNSMFIQINPQEDVDEREEEWDGEKVEEWLEGPKSPAEEKKLAQSILKHKDEDPIRIADAMSNIEPEPRWSLEQYVSLSKGSMATFAMACLRKSRLSLRLTGLMNVFRVQQLENEIAAGLIEEVLQVAEGEHRLVDKMIEAKV